MSSQCICLERIGDNGLCPEHGVGYASGAASLFAGHARRSMRGEMSIVPFQLGYQKVYIRGEKRYNPFLYRHGRRHYAGHGRIIFRTATDAQLYARRWAERTERFLEMKEILYANEISF